MANFGGLPPLAKFYYLPRPYPDELIGSFLIRAGRHLGVSVKKLHMMMGHLPKYKWPLYFHSPLSLLGEKLLIAPETLLYGHTPFPYVTAFHSYETTNRLAASFIHRQQLASALSQSASGGGTKLRFCEKCVQDDQREFGEDYWHRSHNLPYVTQCWKHCLPLMQYVLRAKGMSTFTLPSELVGVMVQPIFADDIQCWIEDMSIKLLNSSERKSPQEWQSDYRALALARGFPEHGKGLSTCSITRAFIEFFGADALAAAKLSLRGENQSWVACLLRKSETSDVTAKHILMSVFLKHAPMPLQVLTAPPGPPPLACAKMDSQFAEAIRERVQELEPGSRLTVKQLLQGLAILEPVRHHRTSLPETNEVLSEFRRSIFSERQVGGRPRKKKKI